jgi:hypothetical protein
MSTRADVEADTHTLLMAIGAPLPPSATGWIERALVKAFEDEGVLSSSVAPDVVHRFCESVRLSDLPDAAIGTELGCSAKSIQRARQAVARVAAGNESLTRQLLGGDTDG